MSPQQRTSNHRRRVLVLTDRETDATALRLTLRKAGFIVAQHGSAIGTTRAIVEHGAVAIVISLREPGASCERLVGMLRANPRLQNLVVVVIGGQETIPDPYAARVDAVLVTDDAFEQLPSLLNRLMHTQLRFADPDLHPACDPELASAQTARTFSSGTSGSMSATDISGLRRAVTQATNPTGDPAPTAVSGTRSRISLTDALRAYHSREAGNHKR